MNRGYQDIRLPRRRNQPGSRRCCRSGNPFGRRRRSNGATAGSIPDIGCFASVIFQMKDSVNVLQPARVDWRTARAALTACAALLLGGIAFRSVDAALSHTAGGNETVPDLRKFPLQLGDW